ncbi:carbon-nitrogen hydrolase family protein [Bifidobacterium sp. 82T24]|uniref:nitrilase-related carbon-nitrogen hydrolase n=1 Tax=Bifidobacterium pluvialisilvae TaxID=2834436 RepID=UPI001C592E88|nr:nitrilase-related carbon-nitrogen hydrolase [Bifidobacterium pluvialisilvae]MBW3088259.1 carbon-nitrogen hydrolase family protein [Bifidobacterium pluvialisilvae]
MNDVLPVAVAQFTVGPEPDANLATIRDYARRAEEAGARLLVLPEGLIARDGGDGVFVAEHAQPLDGPFVTGLRGISQETGVTLMGTVHVPVHEGGRNGTIGDDCRVANTFLAIRGGDIVATYRKLHLYDAFSEKESDTVSPGDSLPPIVDVDGWKIGVMTCYDVRFPETARSLAVRGADVITVSAAWVRGALKERHWALMAAARAVENTCYVLACSEVSGQNIGLSRIIDPLGETVANVGAQPGMITAGLHRNVLRSARVSLPVLVNRRFADPVLR